MGVELKHWCSTQATVSLSSAEAENKDFRGELERLRRDERPGRGALFSSVDFAGGGEAGGDEDGLSAAIAEAERVARAQQQRFLDARDEAAAVYSRDANAARASLHYVGTSGGRAATDANARAEEPTRSP